MEYLKIGTHVYNLAYLVYIDMNFESGEEINSWALYFSEPTYNASKVKFYYGVDKEGVPIEDDYLYQVIVKGRVNIRELSNHLNKTIKVELKPEETQEKEVILIEDLHCPNCSQPHQDIDEWALKPHRTHLCLNCNSLFEGIEKAVSYPTFVHMTLPDNINYKNICE